MPAGMAACIIAVEIREKGVENVSDKIQPIQRYGS